MKKILLAEGSRSLAAALKALLSTLGYEAEIAYDGAQAINRLLDEKFDLLVAEETLGRADGRSLFEAMEKKGIKTAKILLLSRSLTEDDLLTGTCDEILPKPFRGDAFINAVQGVFAEKDAILSFAEQSKLTVSEGNILQKTLESGQERVTYDEAESAVAVKEEVRTYISSLNKKISRLADGKIFTADENGYVWSKL